MTTTRRDFPYLTDVDTSHYSELVVKDFYSQGRDGVRLLVARPRVYVARRRAGARGRPRTGSRCEARRVVQLDRRPGTADDGRSSGWTRAHESTRLRAFRLVPLPPCMSRLARPIMEQKHLSSCESLYGIAIRKTKKLTASSMPVVCDDEVEKSCPTKLPAC